MDRWQVAMLAVLAVLAMHAMLAMLARTCELAVFVNPKAV